MNRDRALRSTRSGAPGGNAGALTDSPTQAMLLAAGMGTRLRPLTDHVPKCMVEIGGKPVLEWNIEHLRCAGVTDIVINLYHLAEVVMDHFGDGARWGIKIRYSLEKECLGTAGGVRNVADFFNGPFFVWYGDNLSTCDLRRLYAFHRTKGGVATIALIHRDDPTSSGIVGIDENDRITRFLEKPRREDVFSNWVSAGIYVLEPTVLAAIPSCGQPDFGRDVFPALLWQGASLYGYRLAAGERLWWIDTPEDLRQVQSQLVASEWVGGRV